MSIIYFFLIYNFYIFIVLISGFAFVKNIFRNENFSIGEIGLFGFVFIYFLTTLLHFFFPINLNISILFYIFSFSYFIFNFKEFKILIFQEVKKYFFLIYILGFITACTSNLHDDWQLYQLPIVNVMQQYKIVFGLISLNDYFGQGHSFYELMSVFQLPVFNNTAIYLLPVIFTIFFSLHLVKEFREGDNKVKLLILFIICLILLRFSRSKEFGTDLPVICLLFLIQLYVLNYLKNPTKLHLYKIFIFFSFSVFLKLYAALAIFYLFIIFLSSDRQNLKEALYINKKNIFTLCLILISIIKNIIISGCLFYQLSNLCVDKKIADWSIGNVAANERHLFTTASARGWKAYIREEKPKSFVSASSYLKLSQKNYFKYLVHDKNFEKFLITIFICVFVIFLNYNFIRKKKYKSRNFKDLLMLIFSFLPVLIWAYKVPNIRYGGYAYIPFFIFAILFIFYEIKNLNFKNLKIFLAICLIFFISKNILRIHNEIISNETKKYPFAEYKVKKSYSKKYNNFTINIPAEGLWCGNIAMLCASTNYLIQDVKVRKSYIFLSSEEGNMIKFINRTAYYDTFEENDIIRSK